MPTEEKVSNQLAISHYLPYVGSIIIFLGVTRLIFFYKAFGVQIVSYLDFSEIITSFLDIIVIVVFFLVFSFLQNFLIEDKATVDKDHTIRHEIFEENHFGKRLLLHFMLYRILIIMCIISLIVDLAFIILDKSAKYSSFLWTLGIFFMVFLIVFIGTEIDRKHYQFDTSTLTRRFYQILYATLLAIIAMIVFTKMQVDGIRKEKNTYGVKVLMDNEQLVVSDSTNYYIGKTQNYLFIYHEKSKTTDIIPMSRVKQITMPDNIK